MNLFERIEVWRHLENEIHIYICFKNLETNLYYVQMMNFANKKTTEETKKYQLNLSYELFIEDKPPKVSKGYTSITEAIEEYDKSFFQVKKKNIY